MLLSNEEVYYFNKLVTNTEPKTTHPLLFCYCIKLLATIMHQSKRSVLDAFAKLWKATLSFVISVYPSAWNKPSPTGRFYM